MSRKVTAYLGLGANLGNRLAQLQQAIETLHHTSGICVTRISSIYETAPVGYLDQPHFYNLVIEIQTKLTPSRLLEAVLQVEKKLHRVRTIRWGPRTIDIDILLYDHRIIEQEDLRIPHPRMRERAFVLIPLKEIAGNIIIPGNDQSVAELVEKLPKDQEIHDINIDISLTGKRAILNR